MDAKTKEKLKELIEKMDAMLEGKSGMLASMIQESGGITRNFLKELLLILCSDGEKE